MQPPTSISTNAAFTVRFRYSGFQLSLLICIIAIFRGDAQLRTAATLGQSFDGGHGFAQCDDHRRPLEHYDSDAAKPDEHHHENAGGHPCGVQAG